MINFSEGFGPFNRGRCDVGGRPGSRRSGGGSGGLNLDFEGRISPYVDFSEFYQAMNDMEEIERADVEKELEVCNGCERINEEITPSV